jgi:toxin ParE1/3/4
LARLVVSPAAKQDLVEAFLYIAQDNLDAAERVHGQLEKAFFTIVRQPGVGRERGEFGAGIRTLPVGRYVIYYRYAAGWLRILRVIHGARDQSKAFNL